MKLREFINFFEFDYELVKEADRYNIRLVDLQGVNLGDIESDRFTLNAYGIMRIVDRLDTYYDDYIVDYLIDKFEKMNIIKEDEDYTYEELLKAYDEYMQKTIKEYIQKEIDIKSYMLKMFKGKEGVDEFINDTLNSYTARYIWLQKDDESYRLFIYRHLYNRLIDKYTYNKTYNTSFEPYEIKILRCIVNPSLIELDIKDRFNVKEYSNDDIKIYDFVLLNDNSLYSGMELQVVRIKDNKYLLYDHYDNEYKVKDKDDLILVNDLEYSTVTLNKNDYGKIINDVLKIAEVSDNYTWFIDKDDEEYSKGDFDRLKKDLTKMDKKICSENYIEEQDDCYVFYKDLVKMFD